ncbi:hypothetical protein KSP39_PZI005682 [Platanthera zijinensis]|uniref:Programmed cell death protein 5 n=1 Tax=Platanthera zijinensis TaxID=2320716 RepID=A0AAP0GAX8_9ASPA
MDDPELEAIRQRRMQEMMAQQGVRNQPNEGQQKAQEDAKSEAEERRQLMLTQVLSLQARERLARIALVKPDKARGVEDVILRAAQTGQIGDKVSEERLISLLEQINTQTAKQTKVTVSIDSKPHQLTDQPSDLAVVARFGHLLDFAATVKDLLLGNYHFQYCKTFDELFKTNNYD